MVGGTVIEARKLNLSLSSVQNKVICQLLYEPNSCNLALIHSDSSISLISKFSLSSNLVITPQTLIPPFNSAACFVQIKQNPSFNCKIGEYPDEKGAIFVTCGPHSGGSKVVLRFHEVGKGKDGKFVGFDDVGCSQNGVYFDAKVGVVVDVSHGIRVLMCGSVNYFAMYLASAAKVVVFGVRVSREGGGGRRRELRLVKCAVIECRLPVLSICVSVGFLVLGEVGGVRVFPLRALVKGKVGGGRRRLRGVRAKGEGTSCEQQEVVTVKVESKKLKLPNGVTRILDGNCGLDNNVANVKLANGHVYSVLDGVHHNSNAHGNHDTVKPRSLRLLQDSGECSMQFVSFNNSFEEGDNSRKLRTTKVISVKALSQEKFLILDSNGDLQVLHMSKPGSTQLNHLPGTIQIQQFAAFPDMSHNSHVIWNSDGLNSIHIMMMPGSDLGENEISGNNDGVVPQSSVTQAIFASEKIQDVIAMAENTVLILGQESLYAYTIS